MTRVDNPPTLIFLHGWASSVSIWEPVIQALAWPSRCLPLPGYVAGAADVLAPTEGVGQASAGVLPKPCVLVGWSLGGLLAIALAHDHAEQVRGLVLVAASPCLVQRPDWTAAMPSTQLQAFRAAFAQDPGATLNRFQALQTMGDSQAGVIRARLKAALPSPLPSPAVLARGLTQLAEQDQRDTLARLTCPVRVLLGAQDRLIPVAQAPAIEALASGIHCSVMAGAAHLPFLADTPRFVKWLQQGFGSND